MTEFKESLSSLGYFWPKEKPANRWPGRVYIDTFPKAKLYCIGGCPGDGTQPIGQQIIHGITEGGDYVTMLEARGWWLGGSWSNRENSTESIEITANYMLVGTQHFDGGPCVRRLSFSSSVVEHVLRLRARQDYKDFRYRRVGSVEHETPILRKQVASYVDMTRRIRFRAFRPSVPTIKIDPMASLTIDFLDLVTPKHALAVLHEFRNLLALICGDLIDLWDVQLLHKTGAGYAALGYIFL
jgi:hypothetical protein